MTVARLWVSILLPVSSSTCENDDAQNRKEKRISRESRCSLVADSMLGGVLVASFLRLQSLFHIVSTFSTSAIHKNRCIAYFVM